MNSHNGDTADAPNLETDLPTLILVVVEGIPASETRVVEGLSEEQKRITSSDALRSNLLDNEWKRQNHTSYGKIHF